MMASNIFDRKGGHGLTHNCIPGARRRTTKTTQHDQHLHNSTEADDPAGMLRTTGQAAEATPYPRTRRLP
jgi:hypothetical protein